MREIVHLAPMSADEISAAEDEPVLIEWRAVRDGTMTAYSALMLAARITLAHFSVSSTMNLPNAPGIGSPPSRALPAAP